MKVIVAGTRNFNDYALLKSELDKLLQPLLPVTIFSGGAPGADTMAEVYATENNIPFVRFVADWGKYGKSAGPIRNAEMAEDADAIIAFWDGKSAGTKDMIKKATQRGLKTIVIDI